jgi:hypothetical protein
MLRLVVDVLAAFTVRFNVAALSQTAALVKCAVCEPAALNVKPFQLYGKALGQMLRLLVEDVAIAGVIGANE